MEVLVFEADTKIWCIQRQPSQLDELTVFFNGKDKPRLRSKVMPVQGGTNTAFYDQQRTRIQSKLDGEYVAAGTGTVNNNMLIRNVATQASTSNNLYWSMNLGPQGVNDVIALIKQLEQELSEYPEDIAFSFNADQNILNIVQLMNDSGHSRAFRLTIYTQRPSDAPIPGAEHAEGFLIDEHGMSQGFFTEHHPTAARMFLFRLAKEFPSVKLANDEGTLIEAHISDKNEPFPNVPFYEIQKFARMYGVIPKPIELKSTSDSSACYVF